MPTDSLPEIPTTVEVQILTKNPIIEQEEINRVKNQLREFTERVTKKETSFATLARLYSEDKGTARQGGELGYTGRGLLDPAFANAAFNLTDPNKISKIVETEFGYHIIQLIDRRGDKVNVRHILLRPVYTMDELNEGVVFLDSIANQIRKESLSFDKAALQFSDDATSKMNGGIVSNHDILERFNAFEAKLTVTKFLREDFAHFGALDDYNALIRLKPGEISPAFLTEDIMGNQLAKIVKLVESIPTHVASLNEDYLRLEEMALNAKQERVFKEWLTKKIDAMYVYIAPEFRDGEFENKSWVK